MFHVLFVDKMAVNQYLFWTECTEFGNKIGSIYGDKFIQRS